MISKPFIEFLFYGLDQLAGQFRQVKIRYDYNETIETHIVELTPKCEYDNNLQLDEAWMQLALECYEQFPYEAISFVSDDSLVAIKSAEREWNNTAPIMSELLCLFEELIEPLSALTPQFTSHYTFTTTMHKTIALPVVVSQTQVSDMKLQQGNLIDSKQQTSIAA